MPEHQEKCEFGKRPAGIQPVPRASRFGTVVDEVGVYQPDRPKDYWKVIQRIKGEDGAKDIHVRVGYYAGTDGDWKWSSGSLMLRPGMWNELNARAITEGVFSE